MNQHTKQSLEEAKDTFYKRLDAILDDHPELRSKIKRSVSGLIAGEQKPKKGTSVVYPSPLPFWWNNSVKWAWEGWVEMRNMKKKPLTQRAADMAVTKLEKLFRQPAMFNSREAANMLNQSTANGWTGIFPLKEQNHAQQDRAADYRNSFEEAARSGAFD